MAKPSLARHLTRHEVMFGSGFAGRVIDHLPSDTCYVNCFFSAMDFIYAHDSDQFDDDSLEEVEETQLDFEEIPETPLPNQVRQASQPSCTKNDYDFSPNYALLFGSKKNISNNPSRSLPNVYLRKDQTNGHEKVLDYRDIVNKKLSKGNFKSMKLKDFKQVQKTLKKGSDSLDSYHKDMQPSEAKRAKLEYDRQIDHNIIEDKGYIAQKMHKVKRNLHILNACVASLQSREERKKFINTRKSVCGARTKDILVDTTIDDNTDSHDDDSLNLSNRSEIPDSLENSETEVLESDLEDYAKEDVYTQSSFIQLRPSLKPKAHRVYANETIAEMNNSSQKTLPVDESDLFEVNETFYSFQSRDNPSATDVSSLHLIQSTNENTNSNYGEVKMKFDQKQSNSSVTRKPFKRCNKERPVESCGHESDLLINPARDHLCKQCQDTYAARHLTEEEINKLIKQCSKHRNHHHGSVHSSSKRFRQATFIPGINAALSETNKKVTKLSLNPNQKVNLVNSRPDSSGKKVRKNTLPLYKEWKGNIDLHSRDSNVLHSTFIPRK